jgi:hypothetical protein
MLDNQNQELPMAVMFLSNQNKNEMGRTFHIYIIHAKIDYNEPSGFREED